PVLAATFGRVSLVAPLANVLVLPLVPPIMLGGALLVAAAFVVPPAAPLCAGLTWVPAAALIHAVHWSAALPHAAAPLPAWRPPAAHRECPGDRPRHALAGADGRRGARAGQRRTDQRRGRRPARRRVAPVGSHGGRGRARRPAPAVRAGPGPRAGALPRRPPG